MKEEVVKLPKEEAERILELPNSYIERGIKKGKEEVVRNMLKKGLSIEIIAEVSGVSVSEIEGLKENL